MPFALPQLLRYRPYLYHLTASKNLQSIASTLRLRCASALLAEAGLTKQSAVKREEHMSVSTNIGIVLIRDQSPLIEGAIEFEDNWDLKRFVEHVNQHVFFWPGNSIGPINPGLNHFERYRSESPAILRFATEQAVNANFKFSRYNSGAPRCSGGRYSPRGSRTYLPAHEFPGTASEVVEVVATGDCALPICVEVSSNPLGPWRPLHGAA
jgi:hypothetical protein